LACSLPLASLHYDWCASFEALQLAIPTLGGVNNGTLLVSLTLVLLIAASRRGVCDHRQGELNAGAASG
jgi:hypothetical protein